MNSGNGLIDISTSAYGTIDKLEYTYPSHSSQLYEVRDLESGLGQPFGLSPVSSRYSYTGAGSLTYDMGKGLSTEYNAINLPRSMTGSGSVLFDYSFGGEKILKTGDGSAGYTSVRYLQGLEIVDNRLESYYHPEGRIRFNGLVDQKVEFTLRDHLGNSVVTFEDINQDGEIVIETDPGTPEIYQRHYFYPFGLEMKGAWTQDGTPKMLYRYNGKEFLSDAGSNMLDYGARYHMPEIGRWGAVDPMGTKYAFASPYNYVGNNPISFIDFDGEDYGLYFDSKTNTLTIRGTYYAMGKDLGAASQAAMAWNSQSGSYNYIVGSGKTQESYCVDFEITVVEVVADPIKGELASLNSRLGDDMSGEGNVYQIVPNSELGAKSNGTTQGNYIKVKDSRRNSDTGMHEMGHSLGLTHASNGIMTPASTDGGRTNSPTSSDIREIIVNPLRGRTSIETIDGRMVRAGRGTVTNGTSRSNKQLSKGTVKPNE